MKRIINGKKYNTETATEVGYASSGLSYRDFGWWEERLYRKRTGEFFLHGEGGPMTNYAKYCGDCRACGEDILPMTEEQAKMWAERHLDGDEYEAIFGEVEE